jgi:diphthamide synthase (EF-2-diphthine--ammonia ligase)
MSEQVSHGALGAQFMMERQEVMENLDVEAFRAYMTRWGEAEMVADMSDEGCMLAMHYGRLELRTISAEAKELSRKWITEHGFRMPEMLWEGLP